MTLRAHLGEFRNRLILAFCGILVGAIGGWMLFDPAFELLTRPLLDVAERDGAIVVINFAGLATALDMQVKVAFFLGLILSAPWWLYQLWAFLSPGLHRREKRYTLGFVFAAVPFFAAGVTLGWFVFPHAVEILTDFRPDGTAQILDAPMYLSFAMKLFLAFGLAFLLPVVMVALTWAGLVPSRFWLRGWRWAVLLIFVFTAVMTPTPDGITMTILAIPIIALYFGAIGVGAIGERSRRRAKAERDAQRETHDATEAA